MDKITTQFFVLTYPVCECQLLKNQCKPAFICVRLQFLDAGSIMKCNTYDENGQERFTWDRKTLLGTGLPVCQYQLISLEYCRINCFSVPFPSFV